MLPLAVGHTLQLGQSPSMSLIKELTERGIDFMVERCVVEMDAGFSAVAMSLIRKQESLLDITFNRQQLGHVSGFA